MAWALGRRAGSIYDIYIRTYSREVGGREESVARALGRGAGSIYIYIRTCSRVVGGREEAVAQTPGCATGSRAVRREEAVAHAHSQNQRISH